MFRTVFGVLAGMCLIVFLSVPVDADAPLTVNTSETFPAVDPCKGEEFEVTLNLETNLHLGHNNGVVGHAERSGWTDTGYVLTNGRESLVLNDNIFHFTMNTQLRHPDGSKVRVHANVLLNVNRDTLNVDDLDLVCVGAS